MRTGGAPAPVVPTPASLFPRLRGLRVIVGVPGIGFRADMRADDPVVQASRTFVPVLSENDYYRAETEQIEAFASLVPIERVWVEHITDTDVPMAARPATIDAPAVRYPVPVSVAHRVCGQRLVQSLADGHVRDLRAVTETHLGTTSGVPCVRLCAEVDWYRWAHSGLTPTPIDVTADLLWLE
jgi:hypothetical protein